MRARVNDVTGDQAIVSRCGMNEKRFLLFPPRGLIIQSLFIVFVILYGVYYAEYVVKAQKEKEFNYRRQRETTHEDFRLH